MNMLLSIRDTEWKDKGTLKLFGATLSMCKCNKQCINESSYRPVRRANVGESGGGGGGGGGHCEESKRH